MAQASEVEEYVGVCIDPETQNRVDDDYCESDNNHYNPFFTPYYYPYGYMIPAVGYMVYGGNSSIAAPYRMGFSSTGGNSTGFRSTKSQYLPSGYSLPANAVVKPATPKAAQPAAPANASKTPAPVRTDIPKVTKPVTPPAKVTIPEAPKVDTSKKTDTTKKTDTSTKTDTKPKNNYKAPSSGLKSTTPRTTTRTK
jgi:hypothetical protein